MLKIAFTIFEIAKQAIIRKIPQEQLLQAVEHHVVKVYQQSIDELEQKGLIDEEVKNKAVNQSNIDAMAQQAKAEQERKQQEMAAESARNAEEAQKRREERRAQRKAEREGAGQLPQTSNAPISGISHKQLRLMSLALVLKILSQDKVTTILNKFDSKDSLSISQYMNMADLESKLDGDLFATCIDDLRGVLPIQRKLTQENVILDMLDIFKVHQREDIEKTIRKERPLVKRFVAQAYDGEYGDLPLRVARVLTQYINESVAQ